MKITQPQKLAKIWNSVVGGSVNRKIFGAAIVVGLGTTLAKFLAVLKELAIAYQFGTANELDAFLIALTIPFLFLTVIAGSFSSALIPTYIKVRDKEGIESAHRLFSGATVWSIGLLVVVTAIMALASPIYLPAIAKGFSAEKLALTYNLLWALSPILILCGICNIWGAVLNAGEKFAFVALIPMTTSVVTVLFLFGFRSWGVYTLVAGLIVGQCMEMVFIGIILHRQGVPLIPRWYGFTTYLNEVANQYLPTIAGSFIMCSTDLIDRSMAATLPEGSVAALNYGNRAISLPIIIAGTAVSTAVLPYFSKMVASEDWKSIRKSLKHYLTIIFVASIPLTGAIILFSEPIVHFLLQRGSFTAEDARVVAQIQSCFAIQIPFYIGCMLVVRLISAMRNNQVLIWGSVWNVVVNIVLNYLFMQQWGVAGIALSTSFVYIFSFVFLLIATLKKLDLTKDINLSPEQKRQMEELRLHKRKRIAEALTEKQLKKFQQIRGRDLSPDRRERRLKLTPEQKRELKAIRQENIDRFQEILTPEQQAKVKRLQAVAENQIQEVLTPEQFQMFREAKQSSQNSVWEGWKKLNLTPDQKAAIKTIRKNSEHKIK
jgi:putative peptidoglycan lipid II flippase